MRDKKGVERRKERKEKKTWARRERKNKNNGKHSPPLGVLFIIYIYIYTKRANNASKFSIFNSSLSFSLSLVFTTYSPIWPYSINNHSNVSLPIFPLRP